MFIFDLKNIILIHLKDFFVNKNSPNSSNFEFLCKR